MGWIDEHSVKPDKKAKRKQAKASAEAHQARQQNQKAYDRFNVEATNGHRSRLEALWVEQFERCDSLRCVECVFLPVFIDGPYGRFLSDYQPDLVIDLPDGSTVYVELKPNHELAMADDRQKRALDLNPEYRFVVIGGYPYSKRGVTVRMLTGLGEEVHKYIKVPQVLKFLGCE